MFEEKEMRRAVAAILGIRLTAMNYPIKCASDVQRLFHVVFYGDVNYIADHESLIVSLHNALTCVIDEIVDFSDPLSLAMLETATNLQSMALEIIDESNHELHLERLPQ